LCCPAHLFRKVELGCPQEIHNAYIAFIVDDIDAVAAELKKRNVEFIWEPIVDDELELKLCFIKDNNGNLIELAQALNT
jgi:extradiol dioxygenase family protein